MQQLKRIGEAVASLNRACGDMRQHIAAAQQDTVPVLEEASSLMSQKRQIEKKQKLLNAFNAHFLVSDYEATILTSTAEPVNEEFFQALRRVKKIHHDSQILLGTEDQRLGLEVLDQSSRQLNAAFEKLHRWVQRELKTLDLENAQISTTVRRSLRVLAERSTVFQNCLDFFAESREHVLSDAFYAALTGSTSDAQNIATKPIEFYAHDPLRYVGDMLAWAHSTTVSERETLEVLFISEGDEIKRSIEAGLESEPWLRSEVEEAFDGEKALDQLVTRDLLGVAKLLRQRTEQVIQSHDDATLVYKIANLIGFYKSTFAKLLGNESRILGVLTGLEESALRRFHSNMRDHVAAVQVDPAVPPPDLSPPDFLEEALEMLKTVAKSYDTSVASLDENENGFHSVLAETLDPFLTGCEKMYQALPQPSIDVFAINCLLAAKLVLAPYAFAHERVAELDETIGEHTAELVSHVHQHFVRISGLGDLLGALEGLPDSPEGLASIASQETFQPDALVATSQQLDDFLPSALMDAGERIGRLRNRRMVQDITEEAAGKFCEDFEFVENKLLAADEVVERDEDDTRTFRDLFPRTSGEIRVLLS